MILSHWLAIIFLLKKDWWFPFLFDLSTDLPPWNNNLGGVYMNRGGTYSNVKMSRAGRMPSLPTVFVPVPEECMGQIIGRGGTRIKQLRQETNTRISSCETPQSGFEITGRLNDCEKARCEIQQRVEKWRNKETSRNPERSSSNPKKIVERTVKVPSKYVGFVMGCKGKNIETIKSKSEASRIEMSQDRSNIAGSTTEEASFIIRGTKKNCVRAESLIRDSIGCCKDRTKKEELGGYIQFVCFDLVDERNQYQLNSPGRSAPKLDGFLQGPRYRIEVENNEHKPGEVGDETISDVKEHLLKSLKNLHQLKDEKQLMIDIWCHFGKVFVDTVDEEEAEETFTSEEIYARIPRIASPARKKGKQGHWKVSFEDGVDPSDVDDCKLPKMQEIEDDFFKLKLYHTHWRYDYAFTTPSGNNVRLKAWEGLAPENVNGPPVEVKNILQQVIFQNEDRIKAWICYPSTTVLKGEIMAPNSSYDYRMKVRAGTRYMIDGNGGTSEEYLALAGYLANCTFDEANHHLDLPDEDKHPLPEGFGCTFYRASKERFFRATDEDEGESFIVIVLDEKGWDSDVSERRDMQQFGIRVVMDSWSEALLSSERDWEPNEIASKLEYYMTFLSSLQDYLFDDS